MMASCGISYRRWGKGVKLLAVTEGFLLNGRVQYAQPVVGYRTGIEPVLLAAAVPARAGQKVLEAGCGAGAGLLCLAARVAGVGGVGVERDAEMAALAGDNFARNGFDGLSARAMDVADLAHDEEFDHVFANPPWHGESSSASPVAGRDLAKRAPAGMLEDWIAAMAGALKVGGTITLILPAAQFAAACGGFERVGVGGIGLLPLWPRAGEAAKLVVLAGRKGKVGAARVLAGLVLHEEAGYSAAAEVVLRGGGAVCWT